MSRDGSSSWTALLGAAEAAEAGGAEEDDGVLNFFAAEAGERLGVLGEDAQGTAIGALEEGVVFVGERERWNCVCLVSHRGLPVPGSLAEIAIVYGIAETPIHTSTRPMPEIMPRTKL